MQFKFLALAGLVSSVAAQTPSLVQALNSTSDLSNLTAIISQQPNLVAALAQANNITILAPNNAAITAFLNATTAGGAVPSQEQIAALLQYHVINGTHQNFSAAAQFFPTLLTNQQYTQVTGGQRVEVRNTTVYSGLRDNSTIQAQTVNFTGGVIHVINRVLTVPENVTATATAFNLTSFYGALNATNLLTAVNQIRDATIFVPNNAAFRAIGSALPNLTVEQITTILQYHIINGTVAYSALLSNMSVPSLQGTNLTISVRNASSVFVNNARVVIPDVLVANGVVHVIDEILNPQNTTAAAGNATAGSPAFSGASSATQEPYTSGQPTPTRSINTGSIASSATGGSSSSSAGAWQAKATGAVGAAALGGLALLLQL